MYLVQLILLLSIYETHSVRVKDIMYKKVYYNLSEARELFDDYIEYFNKTYENKDEYEERLKIFTNRLGLFNYHNSLSNCILGPSKYTDLKDEELNMGGYYVPSSENPADGVFVNLPGISDQFNWSDYNAVTPVRDQERCACWIFCVIGVTQVCFMTAPVGDCFHCCPRNDALDITYKLFTRVRPIEKVVQFDGPKKRFFHFRSNPTQFQIIPIGDRAELSRTYFDPANPTIIYLMGFSEATTGPSTTTLRDAHLSTGDYNFISVDWSRLIAFPWYITAVRNTLYMGNRLADFVQFLGFVGVPASSIHVIGFSLGAEAAGFAGKELRRRGALLGKITGLDPAFPGYSLANSDGHLAKGDAMFVDVLHTNPGIFGFPQAIGDVDFYPNPGSWIQPGCWFDQLIRNRQIQFIYGCSHNRAWRLYAESIANPTGFPATLCRRRTASDNCQINGYMGFGARPPMAGKMYLLTNELPPFAKNGI